LTGDSGTYLDQEDAMSAGRMGPENPSPPSVLASTFRYPSCPVSLVRQKKLVKMRTSRTSKRTQ